MAKKVKLMRGKGFLAGTPPLLAALLPGVSVHAATMTNVLIRADSNDYSDSAVFLSQSLTTPGQNSLLTASNFDPDAFINRNWSGDLSGFAMADDRVVRVSASNRLDVLSHINVANATARWSGTGIASGTGFATLSMLAEGSIGLTPAVFPPAGVSLPYSTEATARVRLTATDLGTNVSRELLADFFTTRTATVVPNTVTITGYSISSTYSIFEFTRENGVLTNTQHIASGTLPLLAGLSSFSETLAFSMPFASGNSYALELEALCATSASRVGSGFIATASVGASCNMANSAYFLGLDNFRDSLGNAIQPFSLNDAGGSNLALPSPFAPGQGAVPEPGTWAMLIAGFGLVGAASRRRRAGPPQPLIDPAQTRRIEP